MKLSGKEWTTKVAVAKAWGTPAMSSLIYGPVAISDPALGCPIVVAAGRVKSAREGDMTQRFATGWGTSFEEAAKNCVYEADETYGAQSIDCERVVHARANQLPGRVVEPPELLCFSKEQYRKRSPRNRVPDERDRVPARWQSSQPIDWILSDARFGPGAAWVPARLCLLGYNRDGEAMPPGDSNGLATGETPEDAAIRGFCELVERDSTAIWWYNKLIPPRIDIGSLDDALVTTYRAWQHDKGRTIHLLNLTLDFPIPVVAAIAHNGDGHGVTFGLGAGSSILKAARHAFGELAQCEANLDLLNRHATSTGTEAFTPGALLLYSWHRQTDIARHPHLLGGDCVFGSAKAITLDWSTCRMLCDERGLEPAIVDLTHVASSALMRVIVPGMRSTKPRFGSGRLYDVPRQLKLKTAFSPIDVSPFPI